MLLVTSYRPIMMYALSSEANSNCYQEASSDNDKSSENVTVLTAVYEAIVPIYKLHVPVVYSAFFELALIEEIVENINVDLPLAQSTYFRILFRTFISPNAP